MSDRSSHSKVSFQFTISELQNANEKYAILRTLLVHAFHAGVAASTLVPAAGTNVDSFVNGTIEVVKV